MEATDFYNPASSLGVTGIYGCAAESDTAASLRMLKMDKEYSQER
jgi:hypothetical protein